MRYGVYGVFDNTQLVYIGSSRLDLSRLEYNHRNWKHLGYSGTKFRYNLKQYGDCWNFVWLKQPTSKVDLRGIEEIEGQLIRTLNPLLNVDQDPVQSSIKNGRYQEVEIKYA